MRTPLAPDVVRDLAHLTRRYVLALALVAALSISGQALVQGALTRHAADARVINIAGRQRMLSQRIAKAALALARAETLAPKRAYRDELVAVLAEWRRIHRGLERGDASLALNAQNSPKLSVMYSELEPSFRAMVDAVQKLIGAEREGNIASTELSLAALLEVESAFLSGMDRIVYEFQHQADLRVSEVRRNELVLLGLVLLTLLFEGSFVFRPAVTRIRLAWERLNDASTRLRDSEAEKSAMLRAIPDIMFRLDRRGRMRATHAPPALAGSTTKELGFGHLGRSLDAVRGSDRSAADPVSGEFLSELLPGISERYLEHAARAISEGVVTSFEYSIAAGDTTRHVEARLAGCGADEVLVLVRDLSERRRLEREILEIGERERERIGQDIHDDLCQQLAGLRFVAESLAVRAARGVAIDAAELRALTELGERALSVASGVARGLYITALNEDGLSAALVELASFAAVRHTISCTHRIRVEDAHLPRDVALQMYRIAQEALNNALKHAGAAAVHIALEPEGNDIVMTVIDDGVGVPPPDARRSGMGLYTMQNRARMIGAILNVESVDDAVTDAFRHSLGAGANFRSGFEARSHGTRVTCRLPNVVSA